MKCTIQVEDPRGENISPMDEKTVTADCEIDITLFNECLTIGEAESDIDSEGAEVPLLPLIREFIALLEPGVCESSEDSRRFRDSRDRAQPRRQGRSRDSGH